MANTTTSLTNVNLLSKAQYDTITNPATDQLWAVETPVVVETYQNGTSWYRIYSDGWIEQGGKLVITSSSVAGGNYNTTNLTFLKPFEKLCSYYVQCKHDRFNGGFSSDVIGSSCRTTEVYQVNDSSNSFTNPYVIWCACGYMA